jgi:preprotein translocase subunit SecA
MNTGLQWTTELFTILGITYTVNLDNMEKLNFHSRITAIQKEITYWSNRNILHWEKLQL